jgi:uncharacterized protein YhfF
VLEPAWGNCTNLVHVGRPALLLRLTRVRQLLVGEVGEEDLAKKRIPTRSPDAWRPLHQMVWDEKLAPFGLAVRDDMPVTAEFFEVLYRQPGQA